MLFWGTRLFFFWRRWWIWLIFFTLFYFLSMPSVKKSRLFLLNLSRRRWKKMINYWLKREFSVEMMFPYQRYKKTIFMSRSYIQIKHLKRLSNISSRYRIKLISKDHQPRLNLISPQLHLSYQLFLHLINLFIRINSKLSDLLQNDFHDIIDSLSILPLNAVTHYYIFWK